MQQVNTPGVRWEWIGEAWNLFIKQWSVWVLMILVSGLIVFAIEERRVRGFQTQLHSGLLVF
jgi:hypothetical protein